MPFTGNTYNPPSPPTFPAVTHTGIRSTYFNATINDIADALTDVQTGVAAVAAEIAGVDTGASGIYTPTIGGLVGISGNFAEQAQWMQVGNIVTVSGSVTLDFNNPGHIGSCTLTLPVASDLIPTLPQAAGTAVGGGATDAGVVSMFVMSIGPDTGKILLFTQNAPVTGAQVLITYNYTYEVI